MVSGQCSELAAAAPAQSHCELSVPTHGLWLLGAVQGSAAWGRHRGRAGWYQLSVFKDVRRHWEIRPDVPPMWCPALLQQLLPAGPGGLGGAEQGLCLVTHPCETPSTEPAEKR